MKTGLCVTPKLSKRARVRFDDVRNSRVLLMPERVVELNETAWEILQLCDGVATVEAIIARLENKFGDVNIRANTLEFLDDFVSKGWIEIGS